MKVVNVDLRSRAAVPRWAWMSVALLFALASVLGVAAYRQGKILEALKEERAELLRQVAQQAAPKTEPAEKPPYDASAREMLSLATSQWPSMLTALESVETTGVTPTALDISPAEHWIHVEVEFDDYGKLLEYIDALNAGEPQPKWSLVQAQSTSSPASGPQAPKSVASITGVF